MQSVFRRWHQERPSEHKIWRKKRDHQHGLQCFLSMMLLNYATTGQWKVSPPEAFTVDHSMICKLGSFITQCHNERRDLEAEFQSTVYSLVEIEPVLKDIYSEQLNRGSNKAQDARLDIHARGFWERHRSTFFDVTVCHPNAVSYRDLEPQQTYRIHENKKSVSTQGEFLTSRMEHLHLWSSPQLAECERSARFIIAV